MNKYLLFGIIILVVVIIYLFFKNKKGKSKYIIDDNDNVNKKYKFDLIKDDPKIRLLHNFLSKEEAEHMIKLGSMLKQQSQIDSKDKVDIKIRSSKSAHIPKAHDEIVKRIEERVIDYLQINPERLEPLQVVVYEKGQEYKPHYDWFNNDSTEIKRGGNRTDTILIYLNTLKEEDGGKTSFPNLDLKFKPVMGDSIHFKNMKNGQTLDKTLHGGEEIKTNVIKYAINVWVREGKFV